MRRTKFDRKRDQRQRRPPAFCHAFIDTAHGLVACEVMHTVAWANSEGNTLVRITQDYAFGEVTYERDEMLYRPLRMVVPATAVFSHQGRWMIGVHDWPEAVRNAG